MHVFQASTALSLLPADAAFHELVRHKSCRRSRCKTGHNLKLGVTRSGETVVVGNTTPVQVHEAQKAKVLNRRLQP